MTADNDYEGRMPAEATEVEEALDKHTGASTSNPSADRRRGDAMTNGHSLTVSLDPNGRSGVTLTLVCPDTDAGRHCSWPAVEEAPDCAWFRWEAGDHAPGCDEGPDCTTSEGVVDGLRVGLWTCWPDATAPDECEGVETFDGHCHVAKTPECGLATWLGEGYEDGWKWKDGMAPVPVATVPLNVGHDPFDGFPILSVKVEARNAALDAEETS